LALLGKGREEVLDTCFEDEKIKGSRSD